MTVDDGDPPATPGRTGADEPAARRRSWRPALALVVAVAAGLALGPTLLVSGASGGATPGPGVTDAATTTATERTLVVTNATVGPGETAIHRIALPEAPTGLAGFELTLELSGGAATVSNASYPDSYGMTTDPAVRDDGRSVTLEAADLADEVRPGETDVTLATVAVTGAESGSTTLGVTDAQIDGDDGGRIDPAVEAGTHTVTDDGPPTATPESGDSGAESTDSDTAPGFAVGTSLAAMAILAAALVVRIR